MNTTINTTLPMHTLFVYGTLLSGMTNNHFLAGASFIGKARTIDKYTMYTNGAFPAITEEAKSQIIGEVYLVSEEEMESINRLEGYVPGRKGNHYECKKINVILDDDTTMHALVFYYKGKTPRFGGWKEVPDGNFRTSRKFF